MNKVDPRACRLARITSTNGRRDGGVRSGGRSQRWWCSLWRMLAEIAMLAMEGRNREMVVLAVEGSCRSRTMEGSPRSRAWWRVVAVLVRWRAVTVLVHGGGRLQISRVIEESVA
ncbi:hypothetical protein VNO80_16073 [Phaseolus coccineus]|uniref:Uncharacterized protein n=1 Tax=Phaseolus coccineus TaxID=3886 RepID=A0AAN9R2U8_PHACN